MSNSRPIRHIERRDLYTSLEARIHYLHTFLDFSSNDIEALLTGAKYIRALIPAIVNIVYKKLLQYDITARAFQTRSTSFEGPLDEQPDENSPQILHRKMFLRGYLNRLCSDPSKMEFWEYLDKVGMMHVGRGRQHPLHIEYIHIGVCLGFIQTILSEALMSHPRLHLSRKIALINAVNKVIWVQNDLFAKWYVRDGDEFAEQTEELVVEREGYLHGKKIIDSEDSESAGSNSDSTNGGGGNGSDSGKEGEGVEKSASAPSACPFKGMARDMEDMHLCRKENENENQGQVG